MKTAFLLCLMAVILVLTGCSSGVDEREVQEAIAAANHCESDDDCALAGSKCPFGCYVYVHEDEAERVAQLIDAYESTCMYDCASCFTVACVKGVCEPSC